MAFFATNDMLLTAQANHCAVGMCAPETLRLIVAVSSANALTISSGSYGPQHSGDS